MRPTLKPRPLVSALALPLLAAAAIATSCARTPAEPEGTSPYPAPASAAPGAAATTASPAPAAAPSRAAGELAYDAPATWTKLENPSPMRKATYRPARADGDTEDADLSVSTAGGSVDANLDRWIRQFDPSSADGAKRSERKVSDLTVHLVEVRGGFQGMMMPGAQGGGAKPGWALLGAIVEMPGAESWFFKLTGPEKTVMAAQADFDRMVGTFRKP